MNLGEYCQNLTLDADGIWKPAAAAAVSYPEDGNAWCFTVEETSFWFRHRNRVIADAVAAFPPAGPIFDVGGGNGFVALGLQQAGFETVLLEPGPQGAANARRRGVRQVAQSTLQDAGLRPDSVPACGLFDVLEHIEDDVAFAAEIRRVLRPGGWLYLTVPAFRLLWSDDDRAAGHFRRYTRASLSRVLEAGGLEVMRLSYFFGVLAPAVLAFRTVPTWLGFRRRLAQSTGRKEHVPAAENGRGWLSGCLDREARRLKRGGNLPCGSSLLAVVRKPPGGPPPSA